MIFARCLCHTFSLQKSADIGKRSGWENPRFSALSFGLPERLGNLSDRTLVLVANRLTEPASEPALADWLRTYFACDSQGRRFAPAYLSDAQRQAAQNPRVKVQAFQLQKWYRTLDALLPLKAALEEHLLGRFRHLFAPHCDLVFYDLTSTYLEGLGPEELAQHGYSRDQRPRNPQLLVGVAMVDGLPVSHTVFAGNRRDSTTVREVLADLRKRFGLGRFVFVGDRGDEVGGLGGGVGGAGAGLLDGGVGAAQPGDGSSVAGGAGGGLGAVRRSGREGQGERVAGAGGDGGRVAEAAFFGACAGAGAQRSGSRGGAGAGGGVDWGGGGQDPEPESRPALLRLAAGGGGTAGVLGERELCAREAAGGALAAGAGGDGVGSGAGLSGVVASGSGLPQHEGRAGATPDLASHGRAGAGARAGGGLGADVRPDPAAQAGEGGVTVEFPGGVGGAGGSEPGGVRDAGAAAEGGDLCQRRGGRSRQRGAQGAAGAGRGPSPTFSRVLDSEAFCPFGVDG